jgi:uncharacterized protein (TIGR02246 family)
MRLFLLISLLIIPGFTGEAQPHRPPTHHSSIATSRTGQGAQTQTPRTGIALKLSNVCGQWAKYWREKQLDKIVGLYAPDAVFLTATGDRIEGINAIRAVFKQALESHNSDLLPRSITTEVSGNLAYDSGDYLETMTSGSESGKKQLKGNYVIVFKRQWNGKWLIIEHVWTDKPST